MYENICIRYLVIIGDTHTHTYIYIILISSVRTRFEFLVQKVNGLKLKKLKTMNL